MSDIAHYHKIVISLCETIRLMAEIDGVIETHAQVLVTVAASR
jgi:hypothetical protein